MAESTLSLVETALITGGGGGIGRAMAETLIRHGKKVILAGRTESKLQDTSREIGAAGYYVLDTGSPSQVEEVSRRVIQEHPDLNCIINNAGVQRPFQFPGAGHDYGFDLAKADQEIDTNIRGPMHLTLRFLPHLLELPSGKKGVIINVSSVLGFLPSSLINPVYNGTKAWLHFFTLNLRSQYAKGGLEDKLKIVEIAPPTVSTELHRERTDPKDNSKEKNAKAMSVEEFMDDVEKGWEEGKDIIAPGPAGAVVGKWYRAYGEAYDQAIA
jgi:short-subunit dehydrogenase involved in D-alanine esterification of teichoic acids